MQCDYDPLIEEMDKKTKLPKECDNHMWAMIM